MPKTIKMLSVVTFCVFMTACQTTQSSSSLSFKNSGSKAPYAYQIVTKPYPIRSGKTSERFEVRSGDCSILPGGWNDCKKDRERVERKSLNTFTTGEHWYGWSLYVPETHINVYPSRVAFGQFHQDGSNKPSFMFDNSFGGLWLANNHANLRENTMKPLISKEDLKGKWHDIVVNARWSKHDDGFFKVWVNGTLKVNIVGKNRSAGPIYFKYGIYRRAVSKSKLDHYPTHVVFYDKIRYGFTRDEVDIRLIEAQATPQ